jgi:ribosomal protein S18 acetylase RimI-like enzyme
MTTSGAVEIRDVTLEDDVGTFGRIVLESYLNLPGHPPEPAYEAELADVASRVRTNRVFGAFAAGRPLGCVTFVGDTSEPHAEDVGPDEATFRMLGVSPEAQGRGIGTALVQRCLQAAEEIGKSAVFIYSGDWMTDAHRVYRRLGFERVPERDWTLDDPPITLLAFTRSLRDPS